MYVSGVYFSLFSLPVCIAAHLAFRAGPHRQTTPTQLRHRIWCASSPSYFAFLTRRHSGYGEVWLLHANYNGSEVILQCGKRT
ncbi:hypothetical protein K438DRAFT_1870425 [Mycena galopus ATCC 62051]|nr:hypothetical protein K438DRAFT_1870425 [Mycena galopus ATCC 62051]